jgi:hypothetical protein
MTNDSPGRGVRFEHRLQINAPAALVWAVLADVNGWSSWNPVYTQSNGAAAEGSAIDLTIKLPGADRAQRARATVIEAVPPRTLRFGSGVFGGLVRATRSFDIAPTSATSCSLTGAEIFGGLLGPLLARLVGRRVEQAVGAVNEALKTTAEVRFRSEGGKF